MAGVFVLGRGLLSRHRLIVGGSLSFWPVRPTFYEMLLPQKKRPTFVSRFVVPPGDWCILVSTCISTLCLWLLWKSHETGTFNLQKNSPYFRNTLRAHVNFNDAKISRTREKKAGNWEIMQFVGRLFNTQRASVVVMRSWKTVYRWVKM